MFATALGPGPIEKDAGTVDERGVSPPSIGIWPVAFHRPAVLETLGIDDGNQGRDHHRLFLIEHLGTDRATSLAKFSSRSVEDAQASFVRDTSPARPEEPDVNAPPSAIDRAGELFEHGAGNTHDDAS